MDVIHTRDAWEDLEAYVGEYAGDYDLGAAFAELYEYADAAHDYVVPTGRDIVEVLQEHDISNG